MFNLLLHTLLPPACAICSRGTKPLCATCSQDLCRINPYWDLKSKLHLPSSINHFYAALEYEALAKKFVATIKYQGLYHYSKVAAHIMNQQFGHQLASSSVQVLVPVPLTSARQRWRGYNQSHLLASHLGEYIHSPVDNQMLVRTNFKGSQTKQTRQGRSNQENPFSAKPHAYTHICLIDDVITTGSTLLKSCEAIWAVTPQATITCASLAIAISASVPDTTDK